MAIPPYFSNLRQQKRYQKNPFSLQIDVSRFEKATEEEKTGLTVSVPLKAVGAGNLTKLLEAKGARVG